MKAVVEKYLAPLRIEHAAKCKDISCGIWSEAGRVELHFSYTPHTSGKPLTEIVWMPAAGATTAREREAFVAAAMATFSETLGRV